MIFRYSVYFKKDDNSLLITHIPLKTATIKYKNLVKIQDVANSDLEIVSASLKSFLNGIEISNKFGHSDLKITLVPQLKGYLNNNESQVLQSIINSLTKEDLLRIEIINGFNNDFTNISNIENCIVN